MPKLITSLFIILSFLTPAFSQNKFEIYLGPNTCNVIHSRQGQQIIYNHTLNAPLWNYGFQLGVNRTWPLSKDFELITGARFQLRGDKASLHEIAPHDHIHDMRFYYLLMPVNIKYKLLNTKEIFLKGGLSLDYLLIQNLLDGDIHYYPTVDSFGEKIGITMQIGYNFKITDNLYAEFMYSQSLTNILREYTITGVPDPGFGSKNQAFEFSLIKKL